MNKRSLHHFWTKIRPIGAVYFAIATIVFLAIGVAALRQNNLTAIALRDEVLKVDEQNGDVEKALRNLRAHVYAHMNSGLGGGSGNVQQPVQLKYRYERLLAAEKARVSTANEKIYSDAQQDCERRFPAGLSGRNRIPCIEAYVTARSVKEQPIPDSLYKFDFVSPRWSPDVAGIALLLAAISAVLFIVRLSLDYWLKRSLHNHM